MHRKHLSMFVGSHSIPAPRLWTWTRYRQGQREVNEHWISDKRLIVERSWFWNDVNLRRFDDGAWQPAEIVFFARRTGTNPNGSEYRCKKKIFFSRSIAAFAKICVWHSQFTLGLKPFHLLPLQSRLGGKAINQILQKGIKTRRSAQVGN